MTVRVCGIELRYDLGMFFAVLFWHHVPMVVSISVPCKKATVG